MLSFSPHKEKEHDLKTMARASDIIIYLYAMSMQCIVSKAINLHEHSSTHTIQNIQQMASNAPDTSE